MAICDRLLLSTISLKVSIFSYTWFEILKFMLVLVFAFLIDGKVIKQCTIICPIILHGLGYLILHGFKFLEFILVLVFAYLTESKKTVQCKIISPYGFMQPKPGSCVQCECRPKPIGI